MVMTNTLRPTSRDADKLWFWLRIDDWPQDVPLPAGSKSVEVGGRAPWPVQQIRLEPDRTIEYIQGWFVVPLTFEQTCDWYEAEMNRRGYKLEFRDSLADKLLLHYWHPNTNVRVKINVKYNRQLNQTRPLIERIVAQPWP